MYRTGLETVWKWAIVEALAPLLGASVFFLAVGAASYIASNDKKNFAWAWKEAFDPIGWMYGAAFVAVHSGIKGWAVYHDYAAVVWFSFSCAALCLLIVVSAMAERGKSITWKPPALLNGIALGLVAVIFLAGALLQFETSKGARQWQVVFDSSPFAADQGWLVLVDPDKIPKRTRS